MAERTFTPRGFVIYDKFADQNGHGVRVQQSSLATEDCVWIFCEDVTGKPWGLTPHLTVDQAIRVRDALTAFIDEHREGEPSVAEAAPVHVKSGGERVEDAVHRLLGLPEGL
jgi:hypothetical protein